MDALATPRHADVIEIVHLDDNGDRVHVAWRARGYFGTAGLHWVGPRRANKAEALADAELAVA